MSTHPRVTSASRVSAVEIRTPPALAAIAKKFSPVVLQTDDTPVPPSNADYFSRMNLPTNIELDSGSYHTYDVQFDTRFVMNYILYNVTALANEMNTKGHPYVTPLSLAGYCFTLFYAHILACDTTFRPTKSWQAARFLSDSDRQDYFDTLLKAYVPPFLADLLLEIAPVYDPRRNNHLFVPSLAGYLHKHDFGRTFPPDLFYGAHHLVASTRTNKDPDDVIDDFMSQELIRFDSHDYTVSNYLGTWYKSGHHRNFVNQDFLSFFNPIVGRALAQRPTFARMSFNREDLSSSPNETIYHCLLLASDENLTLSNTVVTAISSYVQSDLKSPPQLGSVIATLSGTLLLSHSIEPPTVPTWTAATYTQNEAPDDVSDKKFVEDHKFLLDPKAGSELELYPTDSETISTPQYHVRDTKFDAAKLAVKYVHFDGKLSIIPPVLYFQPYDVSPSSLGLTIAAGIKIETSEIAGFMVPIEMPETSLSDNNSLTEISAIAANSIHPLFTSPTPANAAFNIIAREPVDSTAQYTMLALRTAAKSIFPYFFNSLLPSRLTRPNDSGLTEEENHYSSWSGFNVKAAAHGNFEKAYQPFHLWSSYRIVRKYKAPEPKDILFVASFRPIYGANVTLSRSKHPSLLIPH
jgi:hypothetical protein